MRPQTRRRLERLASEHFGVTAFREGQLELLEAVVEGRDALGVLATGTGKSLVYELASQVLPGVTLVVSPLIALMQDQTEKLAEAEVPAARLDSTIKASEQREVKRRAKRAEHLLAYVTPERLEKLEERAFWRSRGVSLLVVDEAHCVSQWGHDFRPAYLVLRDAAVDLGRPPILALTATATRAVAEDIVRELGMRDPRVVRGSVLRPNLRFEVEPTVNVERKQEVLARLLGETRGSAVVYVATVKKAEEVAQWLREQKFRAERYHGQLPASERERVQDGFMSGRTRIVVATKAFGLGIDKPDIRLVVHWNFPDSLESYTQEAGRAGRDGKPARAVLLYRLEDKRVQTFFLVGKYPSSRESISVLRSLEVLTKARGGGVGLKQIAERADVGERRAKVIIALLERMGVVERRGNRWSPKRAFKTGRELTAFLGEYENRHRADVERLQAMMHYAQSPECRVQLIADYFGEQVTKDCGQCDNCRKRLNSRMGKGPQSPRPEREARARRGQKVPSSNEPLREPAAGKRKPKPSPIRNAQPIESEFSPGDAVEHAKFGRGRVEDVTASKVRVLFARSGDRTVEGSQLQLIA